MVYYLFDSKTWVEFKAGKTNATKIVASKGYTMATIKFRGSFVNSLPIGSGMGRDGRGNVIKSEITCVFVNYTIGIDKVCVILPSEIWAEIIITVNGLTVDLNGEYPNILNKVCRMAHKQFPHWQD